jgi:hypothetical protein
MLAGVRSAHSFVTKMCAHFLLHQSVLMYPSIRRPSSMALFHESEDIMTVWRSLRYGGSWLESRECSMAQFRCRECFVGFGTLLRLWLGDIRANMRRFYMMAPLCLRTFLLRSLPRRRALGVRANALDIGHISSPPGRSVGRRKVILASSELAFHRRQYCARRWGVLRVDGEVGMCAVTDTGACENHCCLAVIIRW